jgi:hypothetical protein
LHVVGDQHGQLAQSGFGQFGARSAIVAGVGRRRGLVPPHTVSNDAGYGRLARRLLAVTQDLAQKTPDHDGRRIDVAFSEQVSILGEHSLDTFCRKDAGKGQTWRGQKRRHHLLKTATATARRIW